MASNPVEPLQALSAALAVTPDSKEQADLLAALRESLEAHPAPIPILCTTLIKTVAGAGDSLLKRWVLDLLHFAICRSALSVEARTQLASQSLEVLADLLNDNNIFTVKVAVQCFVTVYALLFRMLCAQRNLRHQWDILSHAKARILEFVHSPATPIGVKLSAIKFMQKVILVQTRGISDPRLQNKNDPNLTMCPTDHPFISIAALEAEGLKLLEGVITMLYTSRNPDILSAILNSWASLVKLRPGLVDVVVKTLTQWTPANLEGLPLAHIKSVEKSVQILLVHISRTQQGAPHAAQINAALATQSTRMKQAVAEDKQRRAAAAEASRKRSSVTPAQEGPDTKRPKLEHTTAPASATSPLASFDFTQLPVNLVTDLIVANIQAFSESALIGLVQAYRHSKNPTNATATSSTPIPAPAPSTPAPPPAAPSIPTGPRAASDRQHSKSSTPVPAPVKDEPVDPLQMVVDEEELEYEPDRLNLELSGGQDLAADNDFMDQDQIVIPDLPSAVFKLSPPKELSSEDRELIVRNSIVRIWDGAKELWPAPEASSDGTIEYAGTSGADLWMLLLVRLVTRVAHPPAEVSDDSSKTDGDTTMDAVSEIDAHQDRLRQTLCDYIVADFNARVRLATVWMNEEWYNDQLRLATNPDWQPNYDTWLNQFIAAYQTHSNGKDKAFSQFLLDLPSVPPDILHLLRESCIEPERRQLGFAALREFVTQRPTLRDEAMTMLLELTTHPDKVTRGAAINTVKRWIPDVQPMDSMIRDFALQLLRRLQSRPKTAEVEKVPVVRVNGDGDRDENMEDGQLPQEDIIQTPYLPEQLELPANNAQILQHVELIFALSTKVPEFLDEVFASYGGMEETVQQTVQELITPLVRALGPTHGKLLTLLRTFPPGAETLALRVLTIWTEHGRPSPQLVSLVKGLMSERELDARFLIPIIAEMDKADILRHLPRIVSILNGQPEPKNLVRSVFSSIVTTPPQTFGSVTSNLPRVRQSELLTPAELMVLLHESEKEIGLKSAIEAIGICFSMTDIYRSEILAVVMNQLVDEPVLPTLFLRTVIQAVSTYRTQLVGFVSTTLLSRLITKKIWTNTLLWDGFIRCAKQIAPASFGALLQLPKDQLRELVDKQPSLKSGLRDYVIKKSGNRARLSGLLDIFGEDEDSTAPAPAPAPTPTPTPTQTPPTQAAAEPQPQPVAAPPVS